MFLQSIKLQNFRNHIDTSLDFNSRLVFLIGNNGEGKTNILEAIHYLSVFKSFRNSSDDEILNWSGSYFHIKGVLNKNSSNKIVLECGYQKEGNTKKKKIKLNDAVIIKKPDVIGEFKCITFSPTDMEILEGGPASRRKFFDIFISTIDKEYYIKVLEYNKILKQRNAILKNDNIQKEVIAPWDDLIADRGMYIYNKRKEVILSFLSIFQKNLQKISGEKDQSTLLYKPDISNIESYKDVLKSSFLKDAKLKYTTRGVHKDNFFIGSTNRDITTFGSQGQKRSAVIALKASIYEYIKAYCNESPVILIDDIIRELDIQRREYFVDLISTCGQVFFTTTDLDGIEAYIKKSENTAQVFSIHTGIVNAL